MNTFYHSEELTNQIADELGLDTEQRATVLDIVENYLIKIDDEEMSESENDIVSDSLSFDIIPEHNKPYLDM